MIARRAFAAAALLGAAFAACRTDVTPSQGSGNVSSTAAGYGGSPALVSATGAGGNPAFEDGGPPLFPDSGIAAPTSDQCLMREPICPADGNPSPSPKAVLDDLIGQCGVDVGCPNECFCGAFGVVLDSNGCATGLESTGGGDPSLLACIVERLNQVRWLCAHDTAFDSYQNCTTPK
jgi:hypothetical protein